MKPYRALIGLSLLAHLGAYGWMGRLPKERKSNPVAIALADSKKKKEEPKKDTPPPPPPPPVEKKSETKAKVAPNEPKDLAPPPLDAPPPTTAGDSASSMEGFADLGLTMGGGSGGLAVPTGHGNAGGPKPSPTATTKKQKVLSPPKDDGCSEDVVKAKLSRQVQPAYTAEGRQASVEGVVKLEITVDENGNVISVKVIKGLGFGLDEAAIAAAKQWTFAPATRCGKAVTSTLKPGVRFQLGS